MRKLKLLLTATALLLGGGISVWAQTDVTSTYITNADFSAITGWTKVSTNFSSANTTDKVTEWYRNKDDNNSMAAISQQLTGLEEGVYRMTIHGFFRTSKAYTNLAFFAETTDRTLYSPLKTLASGTTAYGSTPNSTSTAYKAFTTSEYWMNTLDNIVIDKTTNVSGNLLIGLKPTGQIAGNGSNHWICIGNVKLYKLEGAALDGLRDDIISKATTLYNENTNATGASALNSAITTLSTIADANLTYSDIKTLQTAIETFRLDRMADATVGSPIDATFLIKNAGFEDGAKSLSNSEVGMSGTNLAVSAGGNYEAPHGWTTTISGAGNSWDNSNVTSASDLSMATSAQTTPTEGSYFYAGRRRWAKGTNTISQVISDLPNGSYKISVDLGKAAGAVAGTFTASLNGSSKLSATPTNAGLSTYTSETFIVDNENNDLTIQFANATSGSDDRRFIIDNIVLTYYGDPFAAVRADWLAVWNALDDLDETALPDAAETAITNALAEAEPTTVDGYNTAKSTLQALIDSYAGIKAAYDEYIALKATIEDLKNTSKYTFTGDKALSTFNSTLSTIDASAEAATDAATLTALLPSLKTAGNTFVGAIDSNDGFDLTYNIENNSFETGALSPWTTNGSNDTGVKPNSNGTYTTTGIDGAYLFNTWNNGAGSKVSQTLSSLPEGYYTVTALVASDADKTINILAGATTKGIASDAEGKGKFVEGTTDKTLVSDGSLEIGANSTTWYKSDYFRLTFYTVKAGAAEAWAAAKAAAEVARDDAAYTNVTGSERTELLAEIAKDEPTTAEAYGTATTALQEKTTVFIAAKDSYDGLAEMRTVGKTYTTLAWPRASTAKATALADAIAAAPTNAEDAVTKTNAIVTAYRQFVESNGLAEGVAVAVDYTSTYLAGADPDTNTGWTGGIGTDNRSWELYTKGDGTQGGRYYDGGWSTSAAANINMTRELTLPAGQYQLQITARGSSSLTSYSMSIGGESVDLPCEGGDAAIGTFGHGWSDKFIVFNSDGVTPLTLAITATSTDFEQWISFNRLRLVKLDATLATSEDYAALNAAIAAAEAKKYGFEKDEYAPYENTAPLVKLAEAKAINQDGNNVQEDVQALTAYLNDDSNWSANVSEVNAIHNGNFATSENLGWSFSAWGEFVSGLNTNTNASNGTARSSNAGTLTYGNKTGYTIPLKANTDYRLTFKVASWDNGNKNTGTDVSILNASNEGLNKKSFGASGTNRDQYGAFKTYTTVFTTGEAGDYTLVITAKGNRSVYTDIVLVKAVADEITIDEEVDYTPVASDYANVTLNRKFSNTNWNSFVVPFDIDNATLTSKFGTVEVAEYSESAVGDNSTVSFAKMGTPAITANKPVLLKTSTAPESVTFNLVEVKTGNAKVEGEGNFDFVGTYNASTTIEAGDYFIGSNKLYKSSGATTIKGTRAYIQAKSANARIADFWIEGGETTGISQIENGELKIENSVYNLQGQRVNKAQKGLYIKNGKKVIMK